MSEFPAASGEGDRDTMTSTKMLLLLLSMALVALCSAQGISDGKLGDGGSHKPEVMIHGKGEG